MFMVSRAEGFRQLLIISLLRAGSRRRKRQMFIDNNVMKFACYMWCFGGIAFTEGTRRSFRNRIVTDIFKKLSGTNW